MKIKYKGSKKYVRFFELYDIHFSRSVFDADKHDYMFTITFNGKEYVWYIYTGKSKDESVS